MELDDIFSMKTLVISLAGIGDTLIATPLIRELRTHYPEAQLDVFVLWAGSRDLLEGNPHVNKVHQKNLLTAGPLASLPFLWMLRRQRYDVTLNTHPQSRLAYRAIARIIGAPLRLSHAYDYHTWLDRLCVNRTIPQDYTIHGVENNLRLLSLLDLAPSLSPHEFEVFLTAEETAWAKDYVATNDLEGKKLLGMHVGSGGTKNLALKRWPLEHYKKLLHRFCPVHPDVAVLLFGGPGEEQAHQEIKAHVGSMQVRMPATRNLRQAAALMKHCHAFLSVDTALMHMAAAMKVPNQLVIEAPTLNATNIPWRNPYRLIPNPAVAGRNLDYYRYDGKPIKGTDADLKALMNSVTVESVLECLGEVFTG